MRSKIMVSYEMSCHKETHVQYESPISSGRKVMTNVKVIQKEGQISRSMSEDKILWYHVRGLITRNTHVQY